MCRSGEVRFALTGVAILEPLRLSKPHPVQIIDNPNRGGILGFGTTQLLGSFTRNARGSHQGHRKYITGGRRSKDFHPSCVHTFSLAVNDGASGYELAAHISCPPASLTSLNTGETRQKYDRRPQYISSCCSVERDPSLAYGKSSGSGRA